MRDDCDPERMRIEGKSLHRVLIASIAANRQSHICMESRCDRGGDNSTVAFRSRVASHLSIECVV